VPAHGLAIENGFALVCEMNHGLSVATDGRGRVLAQADNLPRYAGPLRAAVPTRRIATLSPRLGDAFAWACLLVVAATVAALVLTRPRSV
jgi:apolipoprotein N-acyltransferase